MTLQEELNSIKSIFIDTARVIYFIEGHPTYGPISKTIFEHFVNRDIQPYSSVLTLTEVLVKPVQMGSLDLARSFSDFIRSDFNFKLIDVNEAIAESAGYLRGNQPVVRKGSQKPGINDFTRQARPSPLPSTIIYLSAIAQHPTPAALPPWPGGAIQH